MLVVGGAGSLALKGCFQMGRSIQYLLSASPYRDTIIPLEPRYAADWDAADLFPVFMQFFVYKPNMLRAIASPHQVG